MLESGQQAPQFTCPNQDGEDVSLSQFAGEKNVILYFYPKDDTPGCTTEALDFTALIGEFDAADAVVLGVSKDSVAKHQKFITKRDLKVQLLSDESGELCESYGVWGLKKFMGREFMGINRTTFIIDKAGVIREVYPKVKVKGHADAVLEAVKNLG